MRKVRNNANPKKFGKNHTCVSKFVLNYTRSSGMYPRKIFDRTGREKLYPKLKWICQSNLKEGSWCCRCRRRRGHRFPNYYFIIKFFRVFSCPHDCLLLQSNNNSVSDWSAANCIRLNIAQTRLISNSRKTNVLSYECQLCHAAITCTNSIKDLVVFFDSKL
jgi:hypothetical protein